MEVGGQLHVPAALPRERDQVAGWNPGPLQTGVENLPPQGNDPRTGGTAVCFA